MTHPSAPPPLPRRRSFYRIGCISTLIAFPILMAVLYVVENWRGNRAWNKAQGQLAAAGETLDYEKLLPPAIPRAVNFCATQALDGIAAPTGVGESDAAKKRRRLESLVPPSGRISAPPLRDQPLDWSEWLKYLSRDASSVIGNGAEAAHAVLRVFEANRELFDELALAAQRPGAQFLPQLRERRRGKALADVENPHLQAVHTLAKALTLRGRAAIAANETTTAVESLRILTRLRNAVASEPSVVNILTCMSIDQLKSGLVIDGLREHRWPAAALIEIHRELEGEFYSPAVLQAYRAELVFITENFDLLRSGHQQRSWQPFGRSDGLAHKSVAGLVPTGWIKQNKATAVDWQLKFNILAWKKGDLAAAVESSERALVACGAAKQHFNPHEMLCAMAFPIYHGFSRNCAFAEGRRELIVAAVALERGYLANQRYPAQMEELVPTFLKALSKDMDGAPMRYRRDETGFTVWSVGVDKVDNWQGNQPPFRLGYTHRNPALAEDWVLKIP